MIKGRFFSAAALAAVTFVFTGCAGYHAGPIKPTPMANVKTLAVQTFKNDTLEPRIEVLLASTVIKQLQQDGTYKIAREDAADAILEATLSEIERKPARSVRGNTLLSREYDLILRVRYRVVERTTGKELESRSVNGRTSFFVSGSNALAADVNQDERQALPIAAEDLATRLVSQISEGW
jgi:outer membrane lipopolysaccharide assembly protein LptE/RlpB